MTENEKQEAFDKWYDENYDEWAEGEEGIALREELEQAFKSGIAELEKENAELKQAEKDKVVEHFEAYGQCRDSRRIAELEDELKKWKDEWQEQVQKATDEGYARTLQTIQLTKAKEIIRDFLSVAIDYIDKEDKNYSFIVEAEQFLKDLEK